MWSDLDKPIVFLLILEAELYLFWRRSAVESPIAMRITPALNEGIEVLGGGSGASGLRRVAAIQIHSIVMLRKPQAGAAQRGSSERGGRGPAIPLRNLAIARSCGKLYSKIFH
ncbi:hypothetical protein EVAR_82608_1 [Eumeta japonica]|uniref:Uncharacterized protein n=1 Tax=Eumeta variegata TaxID=151549 RepID=A0A4C1X2N9_EUMVA|nr:hypothetical protein EVAR_82608_1 [Eumeta japonica]